jgi:homoserine O-acetyltransferase
VANAADGDGAGAAFASSDSGRHARPLTALKTELFDELFALKLGGSLPSVRVAYETYGTLNADATNAVLVCHAISGDSHVARHDADDDPGWWDALVGPGKALDTSRFFVICSNVLGGCRGTTGPNSENPATGKPYGLDFPTITVEDMVNLQVLLIERLGIKRLHAVVGGSLGGHQALAWAAHHANRLDAVVALATSPRLTSQGVAFDVVARNAIQRDAHFADGQYYDRERGPDVGLAIARMLGFEVRAEERSEFERKFAVGSYLAHQGERFVERFDPNSYITLSMAMDLFDLGGDAASLGQRLAGSDCRFLVVSYSSDWLFPPSQSEEIVRALVANREPVTYCNIVTPCGHDAFLLEDDLPIYGSLVRGFLSRDEHGIPEPSAVGEALSPTHLFRERRDYDHLIELIPDQSSVLDLGCGSGSLLQRLRERGHREVMGVDLSEQAIMTCTDRGIPAIQADLDNGLEFFPDRHFDTVVLSQTLQAVRDVERVIAELLRVGKRALVSFPNAAFHENRTYLTEQGRIPDMVVPERHRWHDSPPLRLFSILDFETFCESRGVQIHRVVALDQSRNRQVTDDPNRNADLAIFVLSR